MPYPEVDQNLCNGSGDCITAFGNVFEWDPSNPGKARRIAGKTCADVSAGGCGPAVEVCLQGAIYVVD